MTQKNCWSKREEEILILHFTETQWNELVNLLPEKTEGQILSKAERLGLKREKEKIAEYYDPEKDAWVETFVHYSNIKSTVSSSYPAKNGLTLKEAKDRVAERFAKSFLEIIQPRYDKFIGAIGYQFDTAEVRRIYTEMERDLFFITNKKLLEEKKNKYFTLLEEEMKKLIADS